MNLYFNFSSMNSRPSRSPIRPFSALVLGYSSGRNSSCRPRSSRSIRAPAAEYVARCFSSACTRFTLV